MPPYSSSCLVLLLAVSSLVSPSSGLIASEPVSALLKTHADGISKLKSICAEQLGPAALESEPYSNDVFFLRYCLSSPEESEQTDRLQTNLAWRSSSAGQSICQAATTALAQATQQGGWDNAPVINAAPHSDLITKYITPSNVVTTTSNQQDLVYCIRAGQIDDVALMDAVSIPQMVDFFLYAKEINAQVANQRSLQSDKLVCVVTANDLAGVKLVGGSADFRKALGESSKQANDLYPATNGPTLLLNLPKLLSALVKLFTPLFSPEVKARLKFEQGPLKDVDDLQQVASTASGAARSTFVKQLDDIVYSG
ncbi:expressed unknown protein [Seminavis robusta]|uniref:CRAL-TRIO domain-containing protein n=1 Tax=Seminavis robusta TaxID=568900 RepID=A0A9N8D9M0_9STRA|nr:expressed unknown protein [Seminavis robusta]|eukprot:Sro9_g007070.1 n/a (311) ;mRNA; f:40372-41304